MYPNFFFIFMVKYSQIATNIFIFIMLKGNQSDSKAVCDLQYRNSLHQLTVVLEVGPAVIVTSALILMVEL